MMGPVGRCLETALRELLDEEAHHSDGGATIGDGITNRIDGSKHRDDVDDEGHWRGLPPFADASIGNDDGRASTNITEIRFDESMSRSIMESYREAVVRTRLDVTGERATHRASSSRNEGAVDNDRDDSADIAAPAALLMGEIDHYNRIGGQWRIIVRNAVLKRRTLTTLDNGLSGRSRRRRTALDWDDDDDDDDKGKIIEGRKKRGASSASSDKGNIGETVIRDSSNVDHFLGTIQILAYDDA
jgi:hypothetical protein